MTPRIGALVRVRDNSYTGEVGDMHNGRVGRVVDVSNGDVTVIYLHRCWPLVQHPPYNLEEI